MLGERELLRLIEANDFPARLLVSGAVWVEMEVTDAKTQRVRRERISKSMFADLILDWREQRERPARQSSLRKIGIAR